MSLAVYHITRVCECNMIYCEGQYSLILVQKPFYNIVYKYILLVRVICEKYRSRWNFSCPRNWYFSHVTLTNRIYLFNSAEYLTVSKTVACKQHCRLEPRNHSVLFFFTIQINHVKFKITADTVVCHFSLLYRWLEEETWVIRNYICDVINDLK